MSAAIEPARLVAGDTWRWSKALDDYPASAGWQLVYVFTNATQRFSVACSASGSAHLFELPAASTSAKIPGVYRWAAYARKAGERREVARGEVTIAPNLEGDRPFDTRTHVERVIDAIEAVIEGRASKDQEEYSIEGRSLKRTPIAQLLTLRDKYRAELESARQAERATAGLGNARYVRVRLGRV